MMFAVFLFAIAQTASPTADPRIALSAEGQATLAAAVQAEADERRASAAQADAANAAVAAAATRRPFDLAAFRAASEARDAIDIARLRARTSTGLALLERLSPTDREVMAPAIVGALQPRPAPPSPEAPLPPPTRR